MAQHMLHLQPKYFELIKCGQKIYEGRLFDEKRRQIQKKDSILFINEENPTQTIHACVKDILLFPSFQEMASALPHQQLGFATETTDEISAIYHQFYTPEKEAQYGVCAIKVQIKNN